MNDKSYIRDTIKKATSKNRRYIDDRSEAPEGVDVQEGPNGGLYYETGESGNSESSDESEDPGHGFDQWDQARLFAMGSRLNAQFGPKLTNSFLRHVGDVIANVDPVMVSNVLAAINSDEEPDFEVGMKADIEGTLMADLFIQKARRYVDDPSDAPDGVDVQEGPQGGLYYETGSADAPDSSEEAVPQTSETTEPSGETNRWGGEPGAPWTWEEPEMEELGEWIEDVQSTEVWNGGYQDFLKAWEEGVNTANDYSTENENGETVYNEERVREVHEPAVEDNLNPDAKSDEPVAMFLIGPPGAGKGWWEEKVEEGAYGEGFSREFTRINSDDTKENIPEYDGTNASYVHDEASHIAKELLAPKAIEESHNLLYDSVAASPEKTKKFIDKIKESDANYDFRAVFVDVPETKSVHNVVKRFEDEGRFTPLDYVKTARSGSRETFDMIAEELEDSKTAVFSNDVEWGNAPEVVDPGEDIFKYILNKFYSDKDA